MSKSIFVVVMTGFLLSCSAGPRGDAGLGVTGATGSTGPVGQSGPTGPSGDTGAQGPIGRTGAVGPAGSVGATGSQGATGPGGTIGGMFTASDSSSPPVDLGVVIALSSTNFSTVGRDGFIRTYSAYGKLEPIDLGPSFFRAANCAGPAFVFANALPGLKFVYYVQIYGTALLYVVSGPSFVTSAIDPRLLSYYGNGACGSCGEGGCIPPDGYRMYSLASGVVISGDAVLPISIGGR